MSAYAAPWNTPSQPVEAPVEPVYVAPIEEVVEEVAPPVYVEEPYVEAKVVKKKKAESTDVTESELPSE
jgi:hypothetical protein